MPDRSNKEILASVEARVNDLVKEQEHLTTMIIGNGREGLLERITRVEENLEATSAALKNLSNITVEHTRDESHKTSYDKKFLGAVVVVTGGIIETIHQIIAAMK